MVLPRDYIQLACLVCCAPPPLVGPIMVEALLKLKRKHYTRRPPSHLWLNVTLSAVTSAICSFFAIATTCYRLYLRGDRFWWDDACAFLSMIFLLLQVAAVFMHINDPRKRFISVQDSPH